MSGNLTPKKMSGEISPTQLTPRGSHSGRNSWSFNFFTKAPTVELSKDSGAPPELAWRRALSSHADQVKEFSVTFMEAIKLAKLGVRMWSYVKEERAQGRVPAIDPFSREIKPLACHGVPLGGMGGGSIGRGFRGDFRRWQFVPGVCEEAPVLADQFSVFVTRDKNGPRERQVSSVLYPGRPKEVKSKEGNWGLGSWDWHLDGGKSVYHALFPRSWTIYDGEPDPELTISCRQVSPFIPHNYQESSLPSCAFVYTVANRGKDDAHVCLLFTFANSIGGDSMLQGGHHNALFKERNGVSGVLLHHRTAKVGAPVTFAIAALETERVEVSLCPRFSVTGQGGDYTARDMWMEIKEHHRFRPRSDLQAAAAPSYPGTAIGGAVAATVTVPAGEKREVVFSLAWDSPIVKFNKGSSYYRRYTQFYGQDGNAAPKLAHDAILGFPHWEEAIEEWQRPILSDPALPPWYPVTLFNELYYLVAGGTVWTDGGPRLEERQPNEWQRDLANKKSLGSSISRRDSEMMAGLPIAEGLELEHQQFAPTAADVLRTNNGQMADAWPAKQGESQAQTRTGSPSQPENGGGPEATEAPPVLAAAWGKASSTPQGRAGGADPLEPHSNACNKTSFKGAELAYAPEHGIRLESPPSPSSLPISASASDLQTTDTEELPRARKGRHKREEDRLGERSSSGRALSEEDSPPSSGVGLRDKAEELELGRAERPLWRTSTGVSLLAEGEENVGQFLYLEGLEYVMWNTYDVHFYASFALITLFPLLELSIQRDFAAGTLREQPAAVRFLMDGKQGIRKVAGSVPHDLGNHDPWLQLNSYNIHDTSLWKDLNSKFVLQVYRDVVATNDMRFARAMWPAVCTATTYLEQFDRDGDGLIENDGFADQTYDAWVVHGVSAYCGGLWLAALQAAAAFADLMDDPTAAQHFRGLLQRGKAAYEEKLWTGKYFKYDSGSSSNSSSIQADQLAGQWYSWSCGLPPLFPNAQARSALRTVFEYNVMKTSNGRMGAVNGMHPNGKVDETCMQSREIWTGVTYAVAAAMLYEGLTQEAFRTAEGIFQAGWQEHGYWFQSPEAWTTKGHFRSLSYMRPMAIWGIQWALYPPKNIPAAPFPVRSVPKGEPTSFPSLTAITSAVAGAIRRPSSRQKLVRVVTCGVCDEGDAR